MNKTIITLSELEDVTPEDLEAEVCGVLIKSQGSYSLVFIDE